jgi:hypothetical protein
MTQSHNCVKIKNLRFFLRLIVLLLHFIFCVFVYNIHFNLLHIANVQKGFTFSPSKLNTFSILQGLQTLQGLDKTNYKIPTDFRGYFLLINKIRIYISVIFLLLLAVYSAIPTPAIKRTGI